MNTEVAKVAVDDYRRLEQIASQEAYDNCDHKSKYFEKCSFKQECDKQGLIDWFFKEKVRWN